MPIRILDAATVGRIAAGEVVERPSSIVKELIENSLDAGATSITVEIRGGGIDYIRVTDNGCGIAAGQVRLAFENHATSKLQNADQLNDIRSLGFRGEALPSIASVSHVEMTTRVKEQETGTKLNIDGGQNLRVSEAGCPEGTTFVMKDLFFNVPVRRAFLKKPAYEGGLIADIVARMIIGNPGVSIRLIHNGSTVYHSYGDGKLRHAIFAVYGKAAAEKMVELDASEGGTRVYGMIGIGELAKPTRAHQMFFINGRSVRCALLTKALERVCKSRVTIGLYPMCALNLVLPPSAVDVNVHPNKLEVRFRDEALTQVVVEKLLMSAFEGEKVLDIAREVQSAATVERVVSVREVAPEAGFKATEAPQMPPLPVPTEAPTNTGAPNAENPNQVVTEKRQNPNRAVAEHMQVRKESPDSGNPKLAMPENVPSTGALDARAESPAAQSGVDILADMPELAPRASERGSALHETSFAIPNRKIDPYAANMRAYRSAQGSALPPEAKPVQEAMPLGGHTVRAEAETGATKETTPDYRVIGVVFNTYILIEASEMLLLIDQHAAHERLRYEMYMKQIEAGTASQQLLTPLILHLSAREMALLRDNLELLTDAGYTVEPFGEHDIQVRAVPYLLGHAELRPLFMEMINSLNRLKSATVDARRAEVMQMACKSAVKGGDRLSESEIQALIREMLETGAPPTCPHGRPVVRTISRREMEKMFKRIQ